MEFLFYYLDDYILLAPPGSTLVQQWLDLLLSKCRRLGVPIAPHKTECLKFLGILIDTLRGLLLLPDDKIHLKRSKCDQFGKGVDVVLGMTGMPICPVKAWWPIWRLEA